MVEVSKSCSSSYLTCAIQSDPETYAGSSLATRRASRSRQVKGVDPDKSDTLFLQVQGWARG